MANLKAFCPHTFNPIKNVVETFGLPELILNSLPARAFPARAASTCRVEFVLGSAEPLRVRIPTRGRRLEFGQHAFDALDYDLLLLELVEACLAPQFGRDRHRAPERKLAHGLVVSERSRTAARRSRSAFRCQPA